MPAVVVVGLSKAAQPQLSACLPVNGEREVAALGEASARGRELVLCPDSRGVWPGMRVVGGACLSSLRHARVKNEESLEVLSVDRADLG